MSGGKIKYHVRGTVAGLGPRTHIICAANDYLARGRFLECYPDREVSNLTAQPPQQEAAA